MKFYFLSQFSYPARRSLSILVLTISLLMMYVAHPSNLAQAQQSVPTAPDYTVSTSGNLIVVTDVTGNGDTLTVSEPSAGSILFSVAGRNFSVDGGPDIAGNSGNLPLAGVTSITINQGNGADTLNIGAFTASFPSLTVNGDAGNDTVNFNGDLPFASNASLNVDLQDDSATPGTDLVTLASNANILTSGSGTITIKCSYNIVLSSGSSLETVNGGITVEANQQATASTGTFVGIDLNNGTIKTDGTGNVILLGKGGNTLDNNIGIRLQAGAQVLSTLTTVGAGSLSLNGAVPSVARAANTGVQLTGTATQISSSIGAISLIGISGGTGGTGGNYGVAMADGATIRSTGITTSAATIIVNGTGGGGNQTNYGIFLDGTTTDPLITSIAGAINVSGTGGTATGPGARGVLLSAGGQITSTGTGIGAATISITGYGGANGTNNRRGIHVTGTGSKITSVDGAITLNGTGGTAGSGTGSRGVSVDTGGLVQATGTASITVTGIEGTGGTTLEGISVESAGTIIATNTGNITFIADQMLLDAANAISINAGTNGVTLRQRTNGKTIAIGAADSAAQLGLTDIELDRVTAGTLTIGDTNSGAITISAVVSPLNYKTLAFGNNTSFATGSGFLSDIGPTAATYEKITVAGTLSVNTTATLNFAATGGFTPAAGQVFTIVENDQTDTTTGNFSSRPEGSLISTFLGSALTAQISYLGNTGNDVVVTVVNNTAIQCGMQAAAEPNLYTFLTGADQLSINVTSDGTNLDCIRVTLISNNHPNATAQLMTGKYWHIQGLQSDQSTPTTVDFAVDVTLPYSTADASDKVCRYSGSDWSCAANSYIANTSITRQNVTQFSDWTVGNNAGPTALTLESFTASTATLPILSLLALFGVAFVGLALRQRGR
ncbi:MAG TPA: hypothetical protein PK530_05265 [Anaerolineales bacterium]|nr:hypothetical protein [Anaerolineales bacterium]